MEKHKEKLKEGQIKIITFLSFLFGFSQSLLIYIMSNYFEIASGMKNVGVFYLVAYIISLTILLNLHKFVKKFGRSNVLNFSLILKVIIIVFLAIYPPGWSAVLLLIFYIICSNLSWVSLDMILESCSRDSKSGRIRGKYLTIMNLGYFIGPFISTRILEKFDYTGIFLVLLVLNLFILFFESANIRGSECRLKEEVSIKSLLVKIIKRKNICRIFYISFVLDFFYALMVIYVPIHLLGLGLGWDKIGIIFTAMLLPFIFLQYPAGILADKKTGEKEMLAVAIIIMGISASIIYFISSTGILIWSLILFSSRIGAALVEILRDSYFYKRIDGYDVDMIDFFKTAEPFAYIVAAILSAFVIYIFSVKAVFILIGVVALSALYPIFRLKDNKTETEIAKK